MTRLAVTIDGRFYEVILDPFFQSGADIVVQINGESVRVVVPNLDAQPEDEEWIVVDDRPYEITLDSDLGLIKNCNGAYPVEIRSLEDNATSSRRRNGFIKAPIPGQIIQVLVSEGQSVAAGETLVILEAMKMENEIRASCSGVVKRVSVVPGVNVLRGEVLAEIGEPDGHG